MKSEYEIRISEDQENQKAGYQEIKASGYQENN
jgi:hypothetical protein